ncbi:unnamed protein product [Mytilus edulis]|uniref:Uncharacterized protein n=1 Tax=Mytilus edulis TaxID=6550 RepID=A0A8S3QEM1_MYTED|nr:unnamed protein product [Mytilus edulis]
MVDHMQVGFSPMDGGSHAGWIFADGWWIICRLDFRRWMVDHMQVGFSTMDGGSHAADIATRGINPAELSNSLWIKGPAFLYNISLGNLDNGPHQLVDADSDKEIRPEVQVAKTQTVDQNNVHRLGTHRFSKFSEWRTLVRAISLLKQLVRNRAHHNDKPEHLDAYKQPDALKQAQQFIIREVQMENYRDEIDSIKHGTSLHNNSSLSQLSPILDVDDTLRVGVAIVEKTFPSSDQKVRKVQIRVVRDGKPVSYVRPINELVMLVEHVELKESEID